MRSGAQNVCQGVSGHLRIFRSCNAWVLPSALETSLVASVLCPPGDAGNTCVAAVRCTDRDRLNVKPEEFALMVAEPTHNTRSCRERLVEMVFETFNAPALFLAKNAMLTSFASARQTALVVDAGYRSTTGGAGV